MRKAHLLFVALLLVLSATVLWVYGRPAYRNFKERRALAQAKEFFSAQNYRQASVSARAVLVANPINLEATSMLCHLAEMARAPQALDWRRRVAELAPTPENKLLLASTALQLQSPPFPLAAAALNELSNSPPFSAEFHRVCAELCLKLNNLSGAERQFEAAACLEPTNEFFRLNLSVLRLASSNYAEAEVARMDLKRLGSLPTVGPVALRWLVADAVKHEAFSVAVDCSRKLLREGGSTMEDRLQYLGVLRSGRDAGFLDELNAVQRANVTNAAAIYVISGWMLKQGLLDQTWDWLQTCPVEFRSQQPAPMAVVDCLMARKDWVGMETYLAAENWGELDFLRHGFFSRALSERKKETMAQAMWRSAVADAGDRLGPLTALLEIAKSGGRGRDVEDLLWQIRERFPREKWVVKDLEQAYLVSGNTRGLHKLYSARVKYEPANYVAGNNLAVTSLLLKQDLAKAHALAKATYDRHPEEAEIAATYAFSLHLQGRTREGLEVLEKLGAKPLETPSVALYYGVLFSASGDAVRAAKYFQKVKDLPMLPEEKALMGFGEGN